jgi:sRNA-binding regulator protein Hfq
MQEILRLTARLGVSQEQLEQRLGKSLQSLLRPEAKEWIKRLRQMAEELVPSPKVKFGHWPRSQEDEEAVYLREQKQAAAPFTFKLFNGEQFEGVITDFTPYTITIKPVDGEEELVLRKLAIAYYRRLPAPAGVEGKAEK